MSYSARAKALRQCTGRTKAGERCRAWATWDSGDRQLCVVHLGRHHRGPLPERYAPHQHAAYPLCECGGYGFPHRPGGGDACAYFEGRRARPQEEERWRPPVLTREQEIALVLERLGLTNAEDRG
jgi:hypothetical protein